MEHTFKPTHYHATMGWHEPVLRVADGDSIVTTTVDARGYDHTGAKVAPPGNAQTGPFFIEGAEPGDTLAVTLDYIRPSRATGFTRVRIAANVLDPFHHDEIVAPEIIEYAIDRQAMTATLDLPDSNLRRLHVQLRPMLGCFGVAPAQGQAISCATSGPYGGNMDYRGFVAGATVYFPVFAPGALLHVGDGHAWQADGEILGTGIETSMDVRVTVHVLKKQTIQWPRGESATHIFTVGNARPLDQAVQHATTEMLRWLTSSYKLDTLGAHLLLGTMVEYEVGNVFDPAYTMVCKLRKDVLRRG